MANYKLIESGSGLVQNIVLWDGESEYNVPEGYILQLITESIEWNGVSSSLSEFESTPYSGDFLGNFYGKLYVSSSYALTASYALNGGSGTGTTSTGSFTGSFTGSVYGDVTGSLTGSLTGSGTGSWTGSFSGRLSGSLIGSFTGSAIANVTGSFSGSFTGSFSGTSSYANTASFVPSIKSGTSPSSSATQSIAGEYIYNISFGTNYLTNNYAVNVTAVSDLRIWTLDSKSISGFRINSNSTVATTGDVYWVAIPYNS